MSPQGRTFQDKLPLLILVALVNLVILLPKMRLELLGCSLTGYPINQSLDSLPLDFCLFLVLLLINLLRLLLLIGFYHARRHCTFL